MPDLRLVALLKRLVLKKGGCRTAYSCIENAHAEHKPESCFIDGEGISGGKRKAQVGIGFYA